MTDRLDLGPAWHPKRPLRAAELLALERYMFSADRIRALDYGVDLLEPDSVRVRDGEISVRGLRGIASSGEPADLGSAEVSRQGEVPSGAFHLALEVNPRRDGSDPQPAKWILNVRPSSDAADEHGAGRLYLGCVTRNGGDRVRWERMPFVRRLAAVQRIAGWDDWVEPLTARIKDILQSADSPSNQRHGPEYAGAVSRLAFHWRTMPLPQLAELVSYVCWLGSKTARAEWPKGAGCGFEWKEGDGHGVVKRLAHLLDSLVASADRQLEATEYTRKDSNGELSLQFTAHLQGKLVQLRLRRVAMKSMVAGASAALVKPVEVNHIVVKTPDQRATVPATGGQPPAGFQAVFPLASVVPGVVYKVSGLASVVEQVEFWV